MREDPGRRGLLFAGTESGLFISFDDGANWAPFQRNLPVVPITDMTIKREDLVVATQGRSFWVLDDLTPLRQWKPGIGAQAVHLFEPRVAHRLPGSVSEQPDAGRNRPNGLIVNFWLKDKPKADVPVTIEFLDGGAVVRTLTSVEKKAEADELAEPGDEGEDDEEKAIEPVAGVNRVVWNLRQSAPTLFKPRYTYGDFPPQGIRLTPGRYRVRVKVGSETREAPFEVHSNPSLKVPAEDLKAQADFLHAVRDDLLALNAAVRRIKDTKLQLAGLQKRADAIGKGEGLKAKTEALAKTLSGIADELYNPNIRTSQDSLNFLPKLDFQISGVGGMSDGADARPTAAALARHKALQGQLKEILGRLDVALSRDLGALNKAVADAGIPPVIVVPFEKKR